MQCSSSSLNSCCTACAAALEVDAFVPEEDEDEDEEEDEEGEGTFSSRSFVSSPFLSSLSSLRLVEDDDEDFSSRSFASPPLLSSLSSLRLLADVGGKEGTEDVELNGEMLYLLGGVAGTELEG